MHGSTTTTCASLHAASQRLMLVLGGFGAAGVLMAGGASPLPIGLAMTLAMVSAAAALWTARNSAPMAEPAPAANLENICESVLPLWSGQIESARTQTEEAIHSLSRFTAEQRALHGGSGQGVANSAGVTFF